MKQLNGKGRGQSYEGREHDSGLGPRASELAV
jgi:hypothetical protein